MPQDTTTAPAPTLNECYRNAVRLSGVLEALAFIHTESLEDPKICREGKDTLIFLAEELANELDERLDLLSVCQARQL